MLEKIVGSDVDYNWTLNAEGDLSLVEESDNLCQAIYLRLTAYLNSLNWVYTNYGSTMKDWFGQNNNEYTRSTLVSEISNQIINDPRIKNCEVELLDYTASMIGIKVEAVIYNDRNFEEYYIFNYEDRTDTAVYNPAYKDTHISTNTTGYYAKQGELVTVTAEVYDEDGKIVPIGQVSLEIGGYMVQIENNPQEIGRSGGSNPWNVTYTFRLPLFIELGVHDLTFKYKGIYGFNPCTGTTPINVVDRLPTSTKFIYPEGVAQYYANSIDTYADASTYTEDKNFAPVTKGLVEFFIDEDGTENSYYTIESAMIFLEDVLLQDKVVIRCKEIVASYTAKFMFDLVPRMFHDHDLLEVYSADKEVCLDTLQCFYSEGVHYLISTSRLNPSNPRKTNTNIKLVVVE